METVADLRAAKAREQAAWSTGDYAVVGTTLQIVGELVCEAIDLRAGVRVLDVAAGNGNATLAAARRWCDVTSTDYVPALLHAGHRRAQAEGHLVTFQEADAEQLPFPEASFDVVLSTFGVMFATNQEQAASELARVCKPGGTIGLASWTPDGFMGQLLTTMARHGSPPLGVSSPALWGTPSRLAALFGSAALKMSCHAREFTFRYRSPLHWLEVFRSYYGPMTAAFAALPTEGRGALTRDLLDLAEGRNQSRDRTLVLPSGYLEAVIVRRTSSGAHEVTGADAFPP